MGTPTELKTYPLFCLLQISDPLFPIGGYTQSFGLETYVQKGIVHDADSSGKYLESYLLNTFLYNDLLAVRLAWEYAAAENLEAICRLDKLLCAAKTPRELRTAGIKLGTRFTKIVETVLGSNPLFASFIREVQNGKCSGNYSVMFGLSARLLEIEKMAALSAVVYSTASSIVNNCAKLVPISQKDGQNILFGSQVVFKRLIDRVEALNEESIGACCFGFDLRAMQHERLYTRLYIS